ncbi:UDP-glucosyltransferase 2-like [Adelges cooleyi]|uniref:UDP-glucosyltransferase 2-like n=1 Tax=Adelges cooleyi TaxID=133065 RepID=UPI0021806566|nr:UDP-glucosyltransferase 2-like [Adelges cooleyi]XP_050427338.1 UDP-glucosyltransferase 2-like [Adelges cooleyi]XP_050434110.1 UDP-glucosyltransferase 2-like [Adelges cooleyi]
MILVSGTLQFLVWTLLLLQSTKAGLRILAVEPYRGKSHWNFMNGFLRSLTDVGHKVTVFTMFTEETRENYTEILLEGTPRLNMHVSKFMELRSLAAFIKFTVTTNRENCDYIFAHSKMKTILADTSGEFDVIVVESIASECLSYLAHRLHLPLIYLFPMVMPCYLESSFLGEESNPAYVSNFMASFVYPKSFPERFSNFLTYKYGKFLLWYTETLSAKANPRMYDSVEPVKPSVVFVNSHLVIEPAKPTLPTVINIGGIHLREPRAIPNDIREFIENSPNGVVYFSFGSITAMSSLPEHVQKSFKLALGRLPQRILWKFETEMEDQPENVMTRKWFPQRDILLHPNVKLYIGHGGMSGVYEAVDAGVPMLGFPIASDQPRNIASLVDAGMAIKLDLMSVTETLIFDSANKLINDKKYLSNAKLVSKRFKDRPMSPAKAATYWTEYVVRHNGAQHLKTKAFNLTWYEYYLLDVFLVILISFFTIGYILYTFLNVSCERILFKLKLKTD